MLNGKTLLITGASSGIGRATAEVVAQYGANVVVAARRTELCAQVAEEIRADGGNATHVTADVTNPTDVHRMIEHTIATFGKIDGAFNNAGVLLDTGRIHEMDDEVLDRSWEVNVKGIWLCMKAEIQAMIEHGGGGAIVNDSSRNGLRADIRRPAYTATKHAVSGLTKAAALDYARMNIRINGICPGPIDTDMMRSVDRGDADVRRRIEAAVPLARYGKPEEVGELVAWLLSERASYLTGQMVGIDGGLLAA
ncbi:MAG: glucose 1-dehydrogenase [Chloroflexi bacterium]|nr:glucose 1-dehydrogenase [Chloroflexota bacterium]